MIAFEDPVIAEKKKMLNEAVQRWRKHVLTAKLVWKEREMNLICHCSCNIMIKHQQRKLLPVVN